MQYETYKSLELLKDKFGLSEFGRICQLFLELTLRKMNFKTKGRLVERPDITAERNEMIYNLEVEVKMDTSSTVRITLRDLNGLKSVNFKQFIPLYAFLFLDPDVTWLVVKADELKPRTYNRADLLSHQEYNLSKEINSKFPKIVARDFEIAFSKGSIGLKELYNLCS